MANITPQAKRPMPWAVAHTERRDGRFQHTGNVYHYHDTKAQAVKTQRWLLKEGKYAGAVEYRPGECNRL
jgi:hypothetical protein